MPIHINLLAEVQAAEELRRKDPVKRAIGIGVAGVALMATISLVVQSQALGTNRRVAGISDSIQSLTNDYSAVMRDSGRLQQIRSNLRGLDRVATERFLHGSCLNALQQTTVEDVQLVRLRTQFSYTLVDPARARSGGTDAPKVTAPATVTERVTLVLDARDTGPNPGDRVTRFREALARSAPLQAVIGTNCELRLANLSAPAVLPGEARLSVQFTLDARLPDRIRQATDASGRAPRTPPATPGGGANLNLARSSESP